MLKIGMPRTYTPAKCSFKGKDNNDINLLPGEFADTFTEDLKWIKKNCRGKLPSEQQKLLEAFKKTIKNPKK